MFVLNTIDIWEKTNLTIKINYSRLSESATKVTEGTSRIGESAKKKVKKRLIEGPDMSMI